MPAPESPLEALRAALGDRRDEADAAVSRALEELLETARHALPGITPDDGFVAHVGRHVKDCDGSIAEEIARLRPDDLLLAYACARGDATAIRRFDERFTKDIRRIGRRLPSSGMSEEDLGQEVARRLFSPPTPKIAEYSGRGDLQSWVRIVATRLALDIVRIKKSSERPTAHVAFQRIADAGEAPDLAYFRRLYNAEIRAALEVAAAGLSTDERTALREHYVLGMSVDDLAKAHGVHRATAARRIQHAREVLVEGVTKVLAERHGLTGRELASVMNLIRSQMHITMERLLA